MKNERQQALVILTALLVEKKHLTHAFNQYHASPFTKELCFGVARYFFQLEMIAYQLVKKKPKETELWLILLLGIYQQYYLKIPDYAVVKETVSLVDKIKKPWAKGLVNGVLRTFCREQETIIKALQKNDHFKYNHPPWLVKRLKQDWPNVWQQILQANDKRPPMSLRVNRLRLSVDEYLFKLQEHGTPAKPNHFSQDGVTLENACNVEELPGFSAGEISVQDEAAQLCASLLDLHPHLSILDACCAPGGKTAHMLEREPQLSCLAIDIEARRVTKVQENLQRLNLSAEVKTVDAMATDTWWDGKLFDRILLDAPCSATGVIRRHPDIKIIRDSQEITTASQLQAQLLTKLWPLLKPGGRLVYATCSVMLEENDFQIERFLASHSNSQFLSQEFAWGRPTKFGWQILPGDHNMDGFFYSILVKKLSPSDPV
jgi:16S rRNA (cytosine967-C5)-methyltransferase